MKLDLGCGKNKKEGFIGVDKIDFGQEIVCDLRDVWKWENDSVEEVHSSHFIEHLDGSERVHFYNELYRVMKPGAKAQIIAPYWGSERAYGDPTHKWPPMTGFSFYYLDKGWREVNAPHSGYECDFSATWGYSLHPDIVVRSQEYQQFALTWFREAAQDLIATLIKK